MTFKNDEFGDPQYRPAVGMMILNSENKIFAGQRVDTKAPAWQMPQGGVGPFEDLDQAMLRELEEEIGTKNVEIIVKSKTWYKYDLPVDIAKRLWGGKYKGQRQIWYVLRFRGQDEEINVNTYHAEFQKWKWFEKDELLELIVPFKKDLYAQVFTDLWPYVIKEN
jgi:putative (di)nucleoside polyphosphate hydrolase